MGFCLDKKQINRIQNLIRQDFKKSPTYKEVTQRSKIDKATHRCESCGIEVYVGKSQKNFDSLKDKYPNLCKRKLEVDHVEPVIPYNMYYYELEWNDFMLRVHCEANNLQHICKECHEEKNTKEKRVRKLMRDKRKEK